MSDAPILVNRESPAMAVVTINNPARRNAVSLEMWRGLRQTFIELGGDADIRTIVLTGAAGHFCAGADISEFAEVRSTAEDGARYEREVDETTLAIMDAPKATIAAIEGYCMGGGCALAMACDFRLAAPSANFGIPAARLGTLYNILDLGNLHALVGLANAKRIMYTGEPFDAGEAYRMGFVDQVAQGALEDAVHAFTALLDHKAPLTIAGSKLTLNALSRGEIEAKRPEIERATDIAMESADYREGVRAFMEKRKPRFKGV
ncbi:MAG: enoyl-CoA hydratase-related protein [SAR324 cluster bacterium]|nr:enoyl-CoA hydratase-related protein [SAR324 cluster bacterium]